MRFRPRHYVLIVIILALGVYNLMRMHRAPQRVIAPTNSLRQRWPGLTIARVAGLRQGRQPPRRWRRSVSARTPAASSSRSTSASAQEKQDLDGCQTWLLFYRQNAHASPQDAWRQRSTQHLNNCVSHHRDVSS